MVGLFRIFLEAYIMKQISESCLRSCQKLIVKTRNQDLTESGRKNNANERLRSMLALNAERRRSSFESEISLDEINAEIAAYRAEKD